MKKLLFSICIITGIIFSQKNDAIDTAKEYYQKENYTGVIKILEDALPGLEKTEKMEAHKYLGYSYARINNNISAKEHFKILLKLNPKFKLNKEDADSAVIQILNDAKKEIAQESAMCSCFIPGSGQLIKGDEKKGKILMLGAALSLASSIYFWMETENKKNDYLRLGPDSIKYMDGYYNIYNRWYRISLLSSSIFAGFYVYSILDALLINKEIDISNESGSSLNLIPEMQSIKIECRVQF